MSIVNISDITVLSNPGRFNDPYVFKVTFECLAPLKDGMSFHSHLLHSLATHTQQIDLEWKLIYVGSAENASYDQELDSCMVGPVPMGVNSFEFEVRYFLGTFQQSYADHYAYRQLHLLLTASQRKTLSASPSSSSLVPTLEKNSSE
jgi:hypothetical protein